MFRVAQEGHLDLSTHADNDPHTPIGFLVDLPLPDSPPRRHPSPLLVLLTPRPNLTSRQDRVKGSPVRGFGSANTVGTPKDQQPSRWITVQVPTVKG